MRHSQMFIPTMKDDPADAQVISHRLMMRAGMIRKVAAGIYNYLPLGWRVVQKVATIIREEINRAGGQEILMPMVQPAELWQESGRWYEYGPDLLRLKDRKQADFCLGPTHEEVVTTLVRDHVKSYRQLPITLYQVQTKFRDEIRPRFGLMRGREFIMKDAYSFSRDVPAAYQAYEAMEEAYQRIFTRCGLKFRAVEADTGSIGGNRSHEFQVLAETGEDLIASCDSCGYAANVELARIFAPEKSESPAPVAAREKVATPGKKTIADITQYLKIPESKILKAVMYMVDDKPVMALCLGHHDVNEFKLKKVLEAKQIRMLTSAEIAACGQIEGSSGPVGAEGKMRIVSDFAVRGQNDVFAGASEDGFHFAHVAEGRDFKSEFFDLRVAKDGDRCGKCGSLFKLHRGIEVGHIFYLGTKYSKALKATFLDENAKEQTIEMGCYGIGVGRTAAAAIEQNHDANGIIWPASIAPFQVSLVRLGDDENVVQEADRVYSDLLGHGVEVLYDDRDERAGVKFAEHDLIGCPVRVTIGGRSLKEGFAEVKLRREADVKRVLIGDLVNYVRELILHS